MTMATFGARAEPLAPYTSLRIGGPADFFLRVAAEKDLLDAIQVARENELPVFVLGGGTNLDFEDAVGDLAGQHKPEHQNDGERQPQRQRDHPQLQGAAPGKTHRSTQRTQSA